jgi:copper chaperone CopZ
MLEFDVPGIKSEKCAATIRGAIQGVDGGARCDVDLAAKRVAVESLLPPMDLVEAMEEVGFLATFVPQVDSGSSARKSTGA